MRVVVDSGNMESAYEGTIEDSGETNAGRKVTKVNKLSTFFVKYRASFFARLAFCVEDSSAIGTTAAIVLCSSFGSML